jgi:hypothetical protein
VTPHRRAAVVALALALGVRPPLPLAAQVPSRFSGGLGVQGLHVLTEVGPQVQRLSGTMLGGEGRLRFGPVRIHAEYWQGTVDPDSGAATSRDVVEGQLLLGVRPWAWLTLRVGPHARAYVTPAGTQRWLMWETQIRLEPVLVPGRVHGYLDVWRVAGASVNVPEAFSDGAGGAAGMVVQLARSPLWGRLGYGIERIRLGGGRSESVDRLTLTVGIGRP